MSVAPLNIYGQTPMYVRVPTCSCTRKATRDMDFDASEVGTMAEVGKVTHAISCNHSSKSSAITNWQQIEREIFSEPLALNTPELLQ